MSLSKPESTRKRSRADKATQRGWKSIPKHYAHYFPKECVMDAGDTIDVYVSSNLSNDGFDYFHIRNDSNSLGCNVSCKVYTSSTTKDTCGLDVLGNSVVNSDGYT